MRNESKVQALAAALAEAFETRTRESGETFVALKDGSPDWMTEVVRDGAHVGASIMPDDYRYQWTMDAAEIIADADDADDARERFYEIEGDIYNADLLRWLSSDLRNAFIADELLEEGWSGESLYGLIQAAQVRAKREVADGVLRELEAVAEEIEDGEEVEA